MTNPLLPALLVAARNKFLDSAGFDTMYAADLIGYWKSPPSPWVFLATDSDGRPWAYGQGKCAVTMRISGKEWTRSPTSARFPRLEFSVWADGDVNTGSGEWLARHVADAIVAEFDDFANEQSKQWGNSVYVISCRYAADFIVAEAEGLPGLYRGDLSFEVEIG